MIPRIAALAVLTIGPAALLHAQGASSAQDGQLDVWAIALGAVAGLVLFLYGITRMADALRELAGDRMRQILARFTTNRFAGVLTGTAVTAALDSSSVTIILVIGLVSAGLLTFVQSLGVVMGANIGTTIGSQIIAFEVERYAPLLLALGVGLQFLGRTVRQKQSGQAVLGVGLILFELGEIGEAAEPLKEYSPFLRLMARMEDPVRGALVGALVTVLPPRWESPSRWRARA